MKPYCDRSRDDPSPPPGYEELSKNSVPDAFDAPRTVSTFKAKVVWSMIIIATLIAIWWSIRTP